jgi:hypothetical protein
MQEVKLSSKVTGKLGYADGHVEVIVQLPWPLGKQTLRIEAEELDDAKLLIDAGIAHREKLFGAPKKK